MSDKKNLMPQKFHWISMLHFSQDLFLDYSMFEIPKNLHSLSKTPTCQKTPNHAKLTPFPPSFTIPPGGSMLSQNPGEQGSLHSGGTIVQYSGQDGSLVSYVPGKTCRKLSKYRLKSLIISVNLVGGNVIAEDQSRKREMRLMKNREAARECRRKKKEYIKCLENRVAVLENQNKALIEELKSLKELYCQQKND